MGGGDGSPAYNASKGGVLGLTMAMSGQLAPKGIRVNAIIPGLVERWENDVSDAERTARTVDYRLGFGSPQDVGEAVRYLVSPASRWASGTVLRINGGYQKVATWY